MPTKKRMAENRRRGGFSATQNGVWLDLRDVKSMYQRVKVTPRDPSEIPVPYNLNAITARLLYGLSNQVYLAVGNVPPNTAGIRLFYYDWDGVYYYGMPPVNFSNTLSLGAFTNGLGRLPDSFQPPGFDAYGQSIWGYQVFAQSVGASGAAGAMVYLDQGIGWTEPFHDARRQLQDNLIFQVRIANTNQPFHYYAGDQWGNYTPYSNKANYVCSGFFPLYNYAISAQFDTYGAPDPLAPYAVNYFYRNFAYEAGNLTAQGKIKTGLLANYSNHYLSYPPTNVFQEPAGSWGTLPSLLTANQTRWLAVRPLDLNFPPLLDFGPLIIHPYHYQQMLATGRNYYGLPFLSTVIATNATGPKILNPGDMFCTDYSPLPYVYHETAPPQFQVAEYDFWDRNPHYDYGLQTSWYPPFPEAAAFSPTNKTQLFVMPVGTAMQVNGYAKLVIANGCTNYPCYLGQYFDTAYRVDASGKATTNLTGVVGPYGDFFATEAGAAAVVTLPDLDSGQRGTNLMRCIALTVDKNRDGVLDSAWNGPDITLPQNPFRFWVNDDADTGDDDSGGGDFGVPGLTYPDGDAWNNHDRYGYADMNGDGQPVYHIQGRRDLVDYFPVYLNIRSLFQTNAWSQGVSVADTNWQFVLSQADGALRFAYTDLTPTNYLNYLLDTNESDALSYAPLTTVTSNGVALATAFLANLATNNGGILLIEGVTSTTQPLVLTIKQNGRIIAQTSLYLSLGGVEQMFRSKTLLLQPKVGMVPDRLTDADVPNELATTNKNFVFLHGYNVTPNEARGVQADMFKRLYWSGSKARFWGVTWEGADTKGTWPFYNKLTPNYHTNVYNAFLTASNLAVFISTLTNNGPVVAAAHSLGNIVTLSAISDWNAPISQYFMLDAAVPVEAIDASATTNMMIYSTWLNYASRLFAANWYQLFPTNDARSSLSWNGRLSNLRNVDVYNFFSSGEEVLRTDTNDPPGSVLGILGMQAINNLWDKSPFGTFTWYWQEKGKGTGSQDWFLCSSHGGWRMNTSYESPSLAGLIPMPPSQAALLTDNQLRTNPFFNPSLDTAMFTTNLSGSLYAAANRPRILADAIPAMSLVAGANPISSFDNNHNKDMMTLENGWSPDRFIVGDKNNNWHHSDFVQMTYTFTYKLFN